MSFLSAAEFADRAGIVDRVARRAFTQGKWRNHALPVLQVPGHGGAGGKVWALALDQASPALRALLTSASTAIEGPVATALKPPPSAAQFAVNTDRRRVLEPVLAHPKGSRARGEAIRALAAVPHKIGGAIERVTERTLRDWVQRYEGKGAAALLPTGRSDKGRKRVLITRVWDQGIGLEEAARARVAAALGRTAAGIIAKRGMPDAKVITALKSWKSRLRAQGSKAA